MLSIWAITSRQIQFSLIELVFSTANSLLAYHSCKILYVTPGLPNTIRSMVLERAGLPSTARRFYLCRSQVSKPIRRMNKSGF